MQTLILPAGSCKRPRHLRPARLTKASDQHIEVSYHPIVEITKVLISHCAAIANMRADVSAKLSHMAARSSERCDFLATTKKRNLPSPCYFFPPGRC